MPVWLAQSLSRTLTVWLLPSPLPSIPLTWSPPLPSRTPVHVNRHCNHLQLRPITASGKDAGDSSNAGGGMLPPNPTAPTQPLAPLPCHLQLQLVSESQSRAHDAALQAGHFPPIASTSYPSETRGAGDETQAYDYRVCCFWFCISTIFAWNCPHVHRNVVCHYGRCACGQLYEKMVEMQNIVAKYLEAENALLQRSPAALRAPPHKPETIPQPNLGSKVVAHYSPPLALNRQVRVVLCVCM